jgi:D-hydroxyproline dehydrogenase subunit beta
VAGSGIAPRIDGRACGTSPRLTTDVIVIGAGIVGAACAHSLARAGLDVHVVEREAPARGASGACEGNLVLWDRPTAADLRLARRSHQRWAELATELLDEAGIDIEFDRKGSLMIATDEADAEAARAKCAWLADQGVEFEWLDPIGLHEAEPDLRVEAAAAAAFFPRDAQIEPRLATAALVIAAHRRGATVHLHEPVLELSASASGTTVRTASHVISAPRTVVAAGAQTPQLLGPLGVSLPVLARKGQIAVVAGAPVRVRHKVMEAGYMRTVVSSEAGLQVAAVVESTKAGTLLLGSSRVVTDPDDTAVDLDVLASIVARALHFYPGIGRGQVVRSYAGLRPMSPDHVPIIGPVPGVPGVIVATGHEGGGVMMAAATGDLVAELVTGREGPLPADPYLPDRVFGATAAAHP